MCVVVRVCLCMSDDVRWPSFSSQIQGDNKYCTCGRLLVEQLPVPRNPEEPVIDLAIGPVRGTMDLDMFIEVRCHIPQPTHAHQTHTHTRARARACMQRVRAACVVVRLHPSAVVAVVAVVAGPQLFEVIQDVTRSAWDMLLPMRKAVRMEAVPQTVKSLRRWLAVANSSSGGKVHRLIFGDVIVSVIFNAAAGTNDVVHKRASGLSCHICLPRLSYTNNPTHNPHARRGVSFRCCAVWGLWRANASRCVRLVGSDPCWMLAEQSPCTRTRLVGATFRSSGSSTASVLTSTVTPLRQWRSSPFNTLWTAVRTSRWVRWVRL